MSTLAAFGIETRRATPKELEAALIAVQCGVADPMVKMLLGHAAAITEERDLLARRLEAATRA